MINSSVVLIRKACGHEYALLGMRAAWAMLAAGLEAKVLLMGEGVYSVLGKGGYLNELCARFLEQGGAIYAVREDLANAGLDEKSLPPGMSVIPASKLPQLAQEADSIMTF